MTENALAVRQTVTPTEWETYSNMALTFVDTEFVPRQLRGRKEAVLAAILAGHELGVGPMQSLKHIAIVDGRPAPSAEIMTALVRRAGHSISAQIGPDRAVVLGKRKDTGDEMTVEWTMAMAKRAGLSNKANWKNYPEAMLWNRAVSQLCRALFADVIAGMGHTPEELGAEVDGEGNVIDAEVIERSGFSAMKEEGQASNAEDPPTEPRIRELVETYGEKAVVLEADAEAESTISSSPQLYIAPGWFVDKLTERLKASQEAPNPTPAGSDGTEGAGGSSSPPDVSQPADTSEGGGAPADEAPAPSPDDEDPAKVFESIDTKRPTWLLKRAISAEAIEIARSAGALAKDQRLKYDDIATLPYEVALEVEGWVDAQIALGPPKDAESAEQQPLVAS